MVARTSIVAFGLCALSAVNAETIQYTASGTLSNSGGLGPTPFPAGTAISLQLRIDSSTPDSNPLDASRGVYAGLTGTFTLAGETYSIDDYDYREVRVFSNVYTGAAPTGYVDEVHLWIGTADFASPDTPVINGARIHRFELVLGATNGTAITTDSLAASIGLNLLQFPDSRFNMQTGNSVYYNSDAIGPVTAFASAVVPIPAAAWLFGGALGVLGGVGRRRAPRVQSCGTS